MTERVTGSWSEYEAEFFRLCYSHATTQAVAAALNRSVSSIHNRAHRVGAKKSDFIVRWTGERMGKKNGMRYGFQQGMTPWNRGKVHRYPGSERTWFTKGHMPTTWRPIGSTRQERDGYWYVKVSDTRHRPTDWRLVHVMEWEKHNGPVPDGHIVVFRNQNKDDVRIDNLECISRAENMRRNQYQRYPKAVAQAIQLRGALNRQINKRTRA